MNELFKTWEFCFIKKTEKEKTQALFNPPVSEKQARTWFFKKYASSPIRHQNAILCYAKGVR